MGNEPNLGGANPDSVDSGAVSKVGSNLKSALKNFFKSKKTESNTPSKMKQHHDMVDIKEEEKEEY